MTLFFDREICYPIDNLPQGEPEVPQKEENRTIPHQPANIADPTAEAHHPVPFQAVLVRDETLPIGLQWVHVGE